MKRTVYLDHSATTPLDKRVLEKMLPYMTENFGNANSLHSFGRTAISAVDASRDTVATLIGAKPNEIYFTSGGSEGDSWAIKSVANCYKNKGNQIIITPIEHPALYASAMDLKNDGFIVDEMRVFSDGTVDLEHLKSIVSDNTIFVGAMMANNEIGTIEPIKEIAKIAHSVGAIAFTDAVQTTGLINYDVKDLGVDMLSMSAHKFYGPKGVGALYVKSGVKISPIVFGGHQEGQGERLGVVVTQLVLVVGQGRAQLLLHGVDVTLCLAVGNVKPLGQTRSIGVGVLGQLLVKPLNSCVGGYLHTSPPVSAVASSDSAVVLSGSTSASTSSSISISTSTSISSSGSFSQARYRRESCNAL